jgi:hypothetical protein
MAQDGTAGDVNVSGSQGIVAGTGNVQNNTWLSRTPLDPVALSQLNPHIAVARLQALSHDELVDFIAGAPSDVVAEVFAAFLEADEGRLVAVLGDINGHKARDLIRPLGPIEPWLAILPVAAEIITRTGSALKWVCTGELEHVGWDYSRKYKEERLFRNIEHGVRAVTGVIETFHSANRIHSLRRSRC